MSGRSPSRSICSVRHGHALGPVAAGPFRPLRGLGDAHYDTISAFIKSMRGSDPDATMYWLAKMVHAGEDPRFISRRILICAAEDIGLADPMAIVVAAAASRGGRVCRLAGSAHPDCGGGAVLATAPKSNSTLWPSMQPWRQSDPDERWLFRNICATTAMQAPNASVTVKVINTRTIIRIISSPKSIWGRTSAFTNRRNRGKKKPFVNVCSAGVSSRQKLPRPLSQPGIQKIHD